MANQPDLNIMILALNQYRAELEDEKDILEKQTERVIHDSDEAEGLNDEIEALEVRIVYITDAIEALEAL